MRKIIIFLIIIALLVLAWFFSAPLRAKKAASYLNLGDQKIAEKNYSEAILDYKKAEVLTPKRAEVSFKIGEGYYAAGDLPKAIDYLENSV